MIETSVSSKYFIEQVSSEGTFFYVKGKPNEYCCNLVAIFGVLGVINLCILEHCDGYLVSWFWLHILVVTPVAWITGQAEQKTT